LFIESVVKIKRSRRETSCNFSIQV